MTYFSNLTVPKTYHLLNNPKKVAWAFNELANSREFAFDIETNYPTWKGKHKVPRDYNEVICGISFAWGREVLQQLWKPGIAAYLPLTLSDESFYWKGRQSAIVGELRKLMAMSIPKIAQNAKFDQGKLVELLQIETNNITFDTMLAHALLDEEKLGCSHALKSDFGEGGKVIKLGMSDVFLDTSASAFKGDLTEALAFYDPHLKRYSKVPLDILYPYGCSDSDYALSLKLVFEPMLEAEGLKFLFDTIVMPLSETLMRMNLHGVPLDIPRAIEVRDEQAQVMVEASNKVCAIVAQNFNVSSPKQLGKILFETLGLQGYKNERGEWVTDEAALKKLDHPVVEHLSTYRRAEQIHGVYAEASLEHVKQITCNGKIGWVHPECWMDSTTGRLKFNKPNITTLPRPENGGLIVKSMWVAENDYRFIFKDYSQFELRVAAHVSGEPTWIEGFHKGHDMHAVMAKAIWHLDCPVEEVEDRYPAERSAAKAVNFGILYGETEFNLAKTLKITVEEAHELIHVGFFGAAPVLRDWIESTKEFIKREKYVNNIFNRKRHLPDASLVVPPSAFWPNKKDIPYCYRKGPYPKILNFDFDPAENPEYLEHISESYINECIRREGLTQFNKCTVCPFTKSCIINREVKHVTGKVNRALRQGINAPIQGSAVDMASLSLIWIDEEIRRAGLDAAPILHIHDELGIYSHVDAIDSVVRIMDECMTIRLEKFTNFRVPITVDTEVVQRWSDRYVEE